MKSAMFQLFFGGCGVDESPQGLRTQAGGTAGRQVTGLDNKNN